MLRSLAVLLRSAAVRAREARQRSAVRGAAMALPSPENSGYGSYNVFAARACQLLRHAHAHAHAFMAAFFRACAFALGQSARSSMNAAWRTPFCRNARAGFVSARSPARWLTPARLADTARARLSERWAV
jgi:hypothetical protein